MCDTTMAPKGTRFSFTHPFSRPLRVKIYQAYVRRVIDPWASETDPTDIAEMDTINLAKRTRYMALGLGTWEQFDAEGEGLDATNYVYAVALHRQAGAEYPCLGLVYDAQGRYAGHADYGRP